MKKWIVILFLFASAAPSWALTFDQYGGINEISCPSGSAIHFYTQKLGSRWWMCDPAGHGYVFIGAVLTVFNFNANQQTNIQTKYGGVANANWNDNTSYWIPNWIQIEEARLSAWGFTAISDGSYDGLWPTIVDSRWTTSDHTPAYKMPFNIGAHLSLYAMENNNGCGATSPIKDFMVGVGATFVNSGATNYNQPDFFDPAWNSCVTNILNTTNNPNGLYAALGTAAGFTTAHNDYFVYATLDEGDQTGFLNAGPDYPPLGNDGSQLGSNSFTGSNSAWIALASSPSITGGSPRSVGATTYTVQENFTKVKMANLLATEYLCTAANTPLSCCTGNGTGTCSVDPNAGAGTAITGGNMTTAKNALNTAWGSSFTTLSTSDSADCGSNLATCLGSTGSPTYNAWGNANCRASGQPLSCCTGSGTGTCGAHGTGLLDEDGSDQFMGDACNLMKSSDPQACITSGRTTAETASMQSDVNNVLLKAYIDQYFGTVVPIMQTDAPGILLQMKLGSFGTPPRAITLQEACGYLTLPQIEGAPPYSTVSVSDLQSRYDFVVNHCGDHPWMLWEGFFANPDSSESAHTRADNIATTQAARGTAYSSIMNACATMKGTSDGEYHCLGWYWWQFEDSDGEGLDWGLTTNQHDNAYDGVESVTGSVTCDQGTGSSAFSCGGEAANYGNFVGAVSTANFAAMQTMVNESAGVGGSNGIQGIGAW